MHRQKVRLQSGVEGTVVLVYQDAIASGTRDYTQVTMVMIKDEHNKMHHVYPREIIAFGDKPDVADQKGKLELL